MFRYNSRRPGCFQDGRLGRVCLTADTIIGDKSKLTCDVGSEQNSRKLAENGLDLSFSHDVCKTDKTNIFFRAHQLAEDVDADGKFNLVAVRAQKQIPEHIANSYLGLVIMTKICSYVG